jgi:hypothetical protein
MFLLLCCGIYDFRVNPIYFVYYSFLSMLFLLNYVYWCLTRFPYDDIADSDFQNDVRVV